MVGHDDTEPSRSESGRVNRRSCDKCRVRKIACDRSTPCSNCVLARMNCTHSAIASKPTTPKRRVLISAQYERKIDEIANDVQSIKQFLLCNDPLSSRIRSDMQQPSNNHTFGTEPQKDHVWDHSNEIVDYVRSIVADKDPDLCAPSATDAVESLKQALSSLEGSSNPQRLPFPGFGIVRSQSDPMLPPLEVVLAMLRWGKEHSNYLRMEFISQILPLSKFMDICRNVFFPVSDYGEIDFVLANGYLYNVFAEYIITTGNTSYSKYYDICLSNFQHATARLPLILPAEPEVIAALTLSAFVAMEKSKGSLAWNLISPALNLCMSLGYHRSQQVGWNCKGESSVHNSLFWTVFVIERELSLRLCRASHVRNEEITLPLDSVSHRVRAAMMQGKVYDQLYSPAGLSRAQPERTHVAHSIATELRKTIEESDFDAEVLMEIPSTDCEMDTTGALYSKFHALCQYSLLALVLRAIPPPQGSLHTVSDECTGVARHSLAIHMQCIEYIHKFNYNPSSVAQYINWPVAHIPFVPFTIIVTSVIQRSDGADLASLEAFVESLKPSDASTLTATHPYRLYGLLCQIARSSIESSSRADIAFSEELYATFGDIDFPAYFGISTGQGLDIHNNHLDDLSEWYHNNQQITSLFNGDETALGTL